MNLWLRCFEIIEDHRPWSVCFGLPGSALHLKQDRAERNYARVPGFIRSLCPRARDPPVIRCRFKDYFAGGRIVTYAPIPIIYGVKGCGKEINFSSANPLLPYDRSTFDV